MNEIEDQAKTALTRQERNAYWISLITGILLGIVSIITLIATIQTKLYSFSGIVVTTLVSIAAFVSAWLSKKQRTTLGSAILLGTILLLSLGLPIMAKGQGLALGVMVAMLVSGIATATLSSLWAGRATLAAVFVGIVITLVDLYTPADFGTPTDPRFTIPIAIVVSILYAFFVLNRFPRFGLRTKLLIGFIGVAILPLGILGFVNNQSNRTLLLEQTNTDLLKSASQSAFTVDTFIQNQLDTVRTEAQIVDLAEYLQAPAAQRAGTIEEDRARRILQALQRKDPIYISSYALLDKSGMDVLDTFTDDIGLDKSNRDYYLGALKKGSPYVSSVQISQTTLEPSIYFSAPVRNQAGDILGILRVRFKGSILQGLLKNSQESEHQDQYVVLVDTEYFVRLAHTGAPNLIFKTYATYSPDEIIKIQQNARLPSGTPAQVTAPEPQIVTGIKNLDTSATFSSPSVDFNGENTLTAGIRLKRTPWVALARQATATALLPVEEQARTSVLLALGIAVLAAGAAFGIAQIISAPVVVLNTMAQKVARGDLTAQTAIKTADEIGTLANTFNSMTSQLRQTLEGLEQSVQERTTELETSKEIIEKRAVELQTISEVSRALASEQDPDKLLPLVVNLVSERFGYYHVGIFLTDESRLYAVLRASNSAGGQRMLERGHKMEVGQTGIVGFVAQQGRPRIALDVGEDAVFFSNPDLPETHSEMALPLNLRGRTIGVLDVQSTAVSAFTQQDAGTLTILADQIAIAIENARLFSETQRALTDAQLLYRQFISQKWEKPLKHTQVGYLKDLAGGKPLDRPVITEEIKQALSRGDMVSISHRSQPEQDERQPVIAVPIKLRDKVIGVIHIRAPEKSRAWSQDELVLAQAVSDRVALALENARLLEDSQRRASRERAITDISSKISAASDIDSILRSTVEELGKTLGNAEVAIQITSETEKQDK
jgi:GAF domain-containing protein/HAMP domain-containing protein